MARLKGKTSKAKHKKSFKSCKRLLGQKKKHNKSS